MKKTIAWILCLAFAFSLAAAGAETGINGFEDLAGMAWSFSSGVGAWSTDIEILPDGSFTGDFHDSEMGDSADEYPYGTVYCCSFSGHMTRLDQIDEYSWAVRVDDLAVEAQEPEVIEDGIRFVSAEPYGLSAGDEMRLYRPGTPVSVFSEEMRLWTHVQDMENPPEALETWFLCSEANDSGFVGWLPDDFTSIANPWEDLSADELLAASGLSFRVPEGAENVIYRYLRAQGLAEMQFTLNDCEYCARVQPAAPQEGELPDISGMYFLWDQEEPVRVGHCDGTLSTVHTDGEDLVALCQWYDAAPGLMYALSVYATTTVDVDLVSMAGQVFPPVQGDV